MGEEFLMKEYELERAALAKAVLGLRSIIALVDFGDREVSMIYAIAKETLREVEKRGEPSVYSAGSLTPSIW